MLNQCLESLVQKVQSGVVLNFEKTGPDPPPIGDGESQDDTQSARELYFGAFQSPAAFTKHHL